MHTQIAVFNKILKNDPNYINVKDKNNILKTILLLRPDNHETKLKFGKYQLMEDKSFFYKAQRLYHILLRFVKKCKFQKTKVFDIDCDLRMAQFEPATKIQLFENNQIYTFNIYDLLNIISTSLLQQTYLFIKPQYPKNPYTNLNFGINNLYNIYIKFLELKIKIPTIVMYFFECEFNIDIFLEKHKNKLSEWAIDTYLSEDATITDNIIEDIFDMCYVNNINLHDEFPKKDLFLIFRPYLKCYYTKKHATQLLDCFELYNPFFGRKYQTVDGKIGFDNRHLPFQKIKDCVFKTICNTKIFNTLSANKYKYSDVNCISLPPIKDAMYFIEDNPNDVEYDIDDIDDIEYNDDEYDFDP